MRCFLIPVLMFAVSSCAAQVHHVDVGFMTSAELGASAYYYDSEFASTALLSPSFGVYVAIPLNPVISLENDILYNRYNIGIKNIKPSDDPALVLTQHITYMADAVTLKTHVKRMAVAAGFMLKKTVRSVRHETGLEKSRDYNQTADFKPVFFAALLDLEYAFSKDWYLYLHWSGLPNKNALRDREMQYYDDKSIYSIESFQIGIKRRLFRWRNSRYYLRTGHTEYY